MVPNKRSPLKSKPLRYAGKSIDKLINDKAILYVLYIAFFIGLAVLETWLFYSKTPLPPPWTMFVIAILVILFCSYRIRKILKEAKSLRLGRDGERIVGERLDYLREKEYKIFHDIVGENFNIDHVIISTKGIFLIETKTYSKPNGRDAKIRFDGKEITVNGMKTDKNILNQVLASSNWLKNLLKESTGKEFHIKPVIVFPGWFIDAPDDGNKGPCWALNENSLPQWIENEHISITKEDVSLAAFHLSSYIRAKE